MKVVYKSYMPKDYALLEQELDDIGVVRWGSGRVYLDETGIDRAITAEIFEGAMSEDDRKTLYDLCAKYTDIDWSHKT